MESFTSYQVFATKNIVGFAADGANVMMGDHNSMKSRLIEDCPGIFILKCICHSLHLCASEACKALPSRCEELARAIYNYFKVSITFKIKRFFV